MKTFLLLLKMKSAFFPYLCKLLHVGRLDIHNVKGLVGDLHVPQVDPQVVRGQVGLLQQEGTGKVSNESTIKL